MTLDRKIWLLLGFIPVLLLAASPLFPSGSDPRGFGPRFAVGMLAFGASLLFALTGTGMLFFAKRLRLPKVLVAVATCIAAAPFAYMLAMILLGRA